ncbi:MAG: hypothetical protein K2N03_04135 [Muribaculaceae bacterium]|nr:hypothetical protein [Muribaculaceae bacterium]
MNKKLLSFFTLLIATFGLSNADAQFYQIANQLPSLLSPMLSGSMNYKGFVDAHYLKGLGECNADFLGVSTSQGFQYREWFFMGVGMGVDVLFSHTSDEFGNWDVNHPDYDSTIVKSQRTSGVMIPIFTDFRFNVGKSSSVAFFADVKVGCSFLVGKDNLRINNGYITNQEYFYLRPALGVRIPVNSNNSKQAVALGINYQLLTANYWSSWNRNVTLNSLGASASFEW